MTIFGYFILFRSVLTYTRSLLQLLIRCWYIFSIQSLSLPERQLFLFLFLNPSCISLHVFFYSDHSTCHFGQVHYTLTLYTYICRVYFSAFCLSILLLTYHETIMKNEITIFLKSLRKKQTQKYQITAVTIIIAQRKVANILHSELKF